jgi:hypothetical protein
MPFTRSISDWIVGIEHEAELFSSLARLLARIARLLAAICSAEHCPSSKNPSDTVGFFPTDANKAAPAAAPFAETGVSSGFAEYVLPESSPGAGGGEEGGFAPAFMPSWSFFITEAYQAISITSF